MQGPDVGQICGATTGGRSCCSRRSAAKQQPAVAASNRELPRTEQRFGAERWRRVAARELACSDDDSRARGLEGSRARGLDGAEARDYLQHLRSAGAASTDGGGGQWDLTRRAGEGRLALAARWAQRELLRQWRACVAGAPRYHLKG